MKTLSNVYRRLFFLTICIASILFFLRNYFLNYNYQPIESMRLLSLFNLFFLFTFILYYLTVKHVMEETRKDYDMIFLKKTEALKKKETEHIREMNHVIQQQKSVALDQLRMLYGSLENPSSNDIVDQINHIQNGLKESAPTSYCSHALLNIILHNKKKLAQSKNIRVQYHIFTPDAISIPMTDLASVFFNLLDNAIEACEQVPADNRVIQFKTSFKGNMLSIHMINSKNPQKSFSKKTTKNNPELHGFGLSIIEDIVHTHQGHIIYNDLDDTFETIILLNTETETAH